MYSEMWRGRETSLVDKARATRSTPRSRGLNLWAAVIWFPLSIAFGIALTMLFVTWRWVAKWMVSS